MSPVPSAWIAIFRFLEAHPGLWAFGSTLAGFLAVFVSALGLYFIWGQLSASRKALSAASTSAQAAADAAKISYSATRPWIKFQVTRAHLYFNSENPEEVGCQIDYRIDNVGKTPAIQAGVVFKPLPVGHGTDTDLPAELELLHRSKPRNLRVLFPEDTVVEGLSTNFPLARQADETMLGFKVIAAAVYKATPEGETYWTPVVLALQHESPPEDRVYRFYRGMGPVPCIVMPIGEETPNPT